MSRATRKNPFATLADVGVGGGNVSAVIVATGSEARPASAVVLFIGGVSTPTNLGANDVWLRQDAPFPPGIPFVSGQYYRLSVCDPAQTDFLILNQAIGNPFVAGKSATINELGVNVVTAGAAGATIRFGMYELDGVNATLIADFGTSTATAIAYTSKTGSAAIVAGKRYMAVVVAQGGATTPAVTESSALDQFGTQHGIGFAPTLYGTPFGTGITGTYSGALPTTGTLIGMGNLVPCIVSKAA